jgi:membrane associated rhomboid family serine protease
MNQDAEPAEGAPAEPQRPGLRLPLARPVLVFVILALIVITFGIETLLGGSTSTGVLVFLGAEVNYLVAQGDTWRLLTAMFLHIGLTHLAFNGWALFSIGREVEAFYGSLRFGLIYFLGGLVGGVASYVLSSAPNVPSAGASGAIFALIGAEIAYFLRNRSILGKFSRQRLSNLAVLVAINLVFGFTVPGINNLAHLGGLVGGTALGLGLSPALDLRWTGTTPELADTTSTGRRFMFTFATLLVIVGGVWLGTQRWLPLLSTGVIR